MTAVHAQEVLSGTVTDGSTGQPMAGVTIFEKGTTKKNNKHIYFKIN